MFSHETTNLLAIGLLIALVALALAALLAARRRTHYTLLQYIFYGFGALMARIRWRAKIIGTLPLADGEGAIIVCNHLGPLDPAFIQLTTNRVVRWLVAREYCEHPLMAWFF